MKGNQHIPHSNHVFQLYQDTLAKYQKFLHRYKKNLARGNYTNRSGKRHQVAKKLRRLFKRLMQLRMQLKVAAASFAFSGMLAVSEVEAQTLGPFVSNEAANPLRQAISDTNISPALVDIDNDGDLDLFLGRNADGIRYFENIGSVSNAIYSERTGSANPLDGLSLPSYSNFHPVFADLDKDGDFDMLLTHRTAYNTNEVLYYVNNDQADATIGNDPSFSIDSSPTRPTNGVAGSYFDVHAALVNIDNDADLDLFLGSDNGFPSYASMVHYTNDDTPDFSVAALSTGLSEFGFDPGGPQRNLAPFFTNFDGDSDFDLVLGQENGTLRYFRNDGTVSAANFGELTAASNPFNGIDVGTNSVPIFADLDNDGDQDAIIGSGTNGIRYFENNAAVFSEVIGINNPFGGIDVGTNAAPTFADIDGDGDEDAIIGETSSLTLFYFENNGGQFSEISGALNPFDNIIPASHTAASPTFANIDGDSDLDLYVGTIDFSGLNDGRVIFYDNNSGFSQGTDPFTYENYSEFSPSLADFDGDGDYDLMVGYYYMGGIYEIRFFDGLGGNSFTELTAAANPFNGLTFGGGNSMPVPEFVDIDHDGDYDVALGYDRGTSDGQIGFILNDGGTMSVQTGANNPWNSIDVGTDSEPILEDIDLDGDLDLFVGANDGMVYYFENQNEEPQLSFTSTPPTFVEEGSAVNLDATMTITDDGADDIIGVTISISGFVTGQETLNFTPQGNVGGSFDTGSGVLTLTGYDILSNYQDVLRSVTYNNTMDLPPSTRTFNLDILDFDSTTVVPAQSYVINITATNDAPTVTNTTTGTSNFVEDGGAIVIDAGVTVGDVDNTNLASATVSITNFQAGDELQFTGFGGITGSYNSGTGVLSLSGSASLANYEQTLQSITFNNTSDNPVTTNRTVEFVVNDGTDPSVADTRTVTVAVANDAPTISTTGSGTSDFIEDGGAVIVDGALTVGDPDNSNLSGATVTITNFQTDDNLQYTSFGGITGGYDSGTGILSLSGSASVANYEQTLQSVTFINTSDNPSTTNRTVAFVVNDGADLSSSDTRTVTVTAVNDAPTVINVAAGTTDFAEDGGAVVVDAGVTVGDVDNTNLASATVTITNFQADDLLDFTSFGGITGSYDSGTGVLTLSGSASLADYEQTLQSVVFNNTSDNPITTDRTVEFVVNDGTDPSAVDSRTVTVTPVNDAPTVNNTATGTADFTEDAGVVVVDPGVTVGDVDNANLNGATITITNVQANDELQFTSFGGITGSYDGGTGVLSLSGSATVADYEQTLQSVTFNNTSDDPVTTNRVVEFVANDGTNTSATDSRTVTVTTVNDVPVIATVSNINYTENEGLRTVDGSVVLTDPDNTTMESATVSVITNYTEGEDVLSITTMSGISGAFDATSGVISLTGTASISDYQVVFRSLQYENTSEAPSNASVTLQYEVFDGTSTSTPVTLDITIASVNDAPVITSTNTIELSFEAGSTAVLIDDGIDIEDLDNSNFMSAEVSINTFITGDQLIYSDQNGITGGYDATTGILTLSGTATELAYEQALQSIGFQSENGGRSVTVEFIVNDGSDNSLPLARIINIQPPGDNLPPTVNDQQPPKRSGDLLVLDLCSIISDPDHSFEDLIITIENISSGATTTIDGCDLIIDYSGIDFIGDDEIVIQACDPFNECDLNTFDILGEIFVYNAVSPNGDGLNDFWEIISLPEENRIEVFNRWGDMVKELINYDGTVSNNELNDLPSGTYFYRIYSSRGNVNGYLVIKK